MGRFLRRDGSLSRWPWPLLFVVALLQFAFYLGLALLYVGASLLAAARHVAGTIRRRG